MSVGFFFKQKTAYELRISDWSSDVCSSELIGRPPRLAHRLEPRRAVAEKGGAVAAVRRQIMDERDAIGGESVAVRYPLHNAQRLGRRRDDRKARVDQPHLARDSENQPRRSSDDLADKRRWRAEEHTYELQSLLHTPIAVFCFA